MLFIGLLFMVVSQCDIGVLGGNETMKRPMTTEELFNKIKDILKEKGKLPSILDNGLATHKPVPIKTYEFDLVNKLAYGGSEGIYLDRVFCQRRE